MDDRPRPTGRTSRAPAAALPVVEAGACCGERLLLPSRRDPRRSTGYGSAIGSRREAAAAVLVEPVETEVADVDDVGRAVDGQVGGDAGHARTPHHPVTGRRGDGHALDHRPSGRIAGPRIGRWSGV